MIGGVIRQRYETETPMFIGVGGGTLKPVGNLVFGHVQSRHSPVTGAADRQFPNVSFEQVETKLENISELPPLLTSGKSPRAGAPQPSYRVG